MTITLELSNQTRLLRQQKQQEYPLPQGKQCPKVKSVFCGALSSWKMELSQHLWLFNATKFSLTEAKLE